MSKAVERHNTVVLANAVELTTQSILKFVGGEKTIKSMGSSKQHIADGVAARINANVSLVIGG